jgi:hypothetical protein
MSALWCALAGTVAAQAPASTPPGHAPKPGTTTALPDTAGSIGPGDAVITLSNACKTQSAGCVNSVSREQFEKLANAVKADMTTDQRRNLAEQYGQTLGLADQARAIGLENDPKVQAKVQAMVQAVKEQILAQGLYQHYSDQYSHPSDQEIQDYYNKNASKYRQATLQRIIVPTQPAASEVKKPTDQEIKAYADQIRQKWAAGGDPVALQKEAMDHMGLTSSVPDINLKDERPGMLPAEQESVFDLKPGDISQPFADPGAIYLYKLVSINSIPLSEVKVQIAKTLHDQMLKDKLQELSDTAKPTLNTAYFGAEKPFRGPTAPPDEGAKQSGTPGGSNSPTASAPAPSSPK